MGHPLLDINEFLALHSHNQSEPQVWVESFYQLDRAILVSYRKQQVSPVAVGCSNPLLHSMYAKPLLPNTHAEYAVVDPNNVSFKDDLFCSELTVENAHSRYT